MPRRKKRTALRFVSAFSRFHGSSLQQIAKKFLEQKEFTEKKKQTGPRKMVRGRSVLPYIKGGSCEQFAKKDLIG